MGTLSEVIARIRFKAWHLYLQTPGVLATTPMLRGVWGRALKHVNNRVYTAIFEGLGPENHRLPKYIIRPSAPDPRTAPSVEWIILNVSSAPEEALWDAWLVACGMGLGPNRIPFRIRKRELINSSEHSHVTQSTIDPKEPVRLAFQTPLRILRRGKLIAQPRLNDIAVTGMRRIANIAGIERGTLYRDLLKGAKNASEQVASEPWHGERTDLVRWSAKQQKELTLHGISGSLFLPQGAQELLPLLSALCWLHVGKGTVYGMGQPALIPMSCG